MQEPSRDDRWNALSSDVQAKVLDVQREHTCLSYPQDNEAIRFIAESLLNGETSYKQTAKIKANKEALKHYFLAMIRNPQSDKKTVAMVYHAAVLAYIDNHPDTRDVRKQPWCGSPKDFEKMEEKDKRNYFYAGSRNYIGVTVGYITTKRLFKIAYDETKAWFKRILGLGQPIGELGSKLFDNPDLTMKAHKFDRGTKAVRILQEVFGHNTGFGSGSSMFFSGSFKGLCRSGIPAEIPQTVIDIIVTVGRHHTEEGRSAMAAHQAQASEAAALRNKHR